MTSRPDEESCTIGANVEAWKGILLSALAISMLAERRA